MLLNNFAKFINFDFNTYALNHLTTEYYIEWIDKLTDETFKAKQLIIHTVFENINEELIFQFIEGQQSLLINLIEKLDKDISLIKKLEEVFFNEEPSLFNLKKFCLACLDDILKLIENDFLQYLNLNLRLPPRLRTIYLKEVEEFKLKFNSIIEENNNPLLDLTIQVVDKSIENILSITYRDAKYMNRFLKEIIVIKSFTSLDENDTRFKSMLKSNLYYLNFNCFNFFIYLVNNYKSELNEIESLPEKIDLLITFRKNIYSKQFNHEYIFKLNSPSIQDQLLDWINEEIQYLNIKSISENATPLNAIGNENFKFLSNLSVAQIGLLFRLFIDVGYLNNKNVSEMLSFVSKYTSTPQAKKISSESLRMKYYNIEGSTKQAMNDILMKMITHLKKDFNL